MRFTRVRTTRCVQAGLFALAMGIVPACDTLSPTAATAETRAHGLRVQQVGGDPFVGDEVGIAAVPFMFPDLNKTGSDDQQSLSGVRIRWSVSPTSVLRLSGPAVTEAKYNLTGGLEPSSYGRFTAVGRGEATITATIEGGVQSHDLVRDIGTSRSTPSAQPHSKSITVQVIGRPVRLELVPATTLTRAGVPVPLVPKLYSAEGDEITFAGNYPFKILIHCLDPGVAQFGTFGGRECDTDRADASIRASGPGTARFEATLVKRDPASTAVVPALRATASVTFTKPFSRVVFEPATVTARVQEQVTLRYRLFDEDNREVPGGDLELRVVDDPGANAGAGSLLLEGTGAGNTFLVRPRSVQGKSEHTVTVQTGRREGVGEVSTAVPFISANAAVRIIPRVTGFDGLPTAITLVEGEQQVLPFTGIYSFGSPITPAAGLQLTSADPAVASVTGSFALSNVSSTAPSSITVRGLSAGPTGTARTTITVRTTSDEGPTSRQISVTVTRAATATLVITPSSAQLLPGQSLQLVGNVSNPGPGTVAIGWVSRDTTRVRVSPTTGLVTAVAPTPANQPVWVVGTYVAGTTTTRDSSAITVVAPTPPTITITPRSLQLLVNQTATITAVVTNGQAPITVAFVSRDTSVATVTGTGIVAARRVGRTYVVASYTLGTTTVRDSAEIHVSAPASTTTLSVVPSDLSVQVGAQGVVTANVTNPVAGITLAWAVRNTAVANITSTSGSSATVQGLTAGTTYAVATLTTPTGTLRDSARIVVTAPPSTGSRVAAIVLEPTNAEITAPASLQYRVRFLDAAGAATTVETGGALQFTSSNTTAATIDAASGLARGAGAGTTTITARYLLNGTQVATVQTPLVVYAAGSAGHFGSVEISTASNAREVRVGQDLIFQVIVRDVNGNQVTSGVTGLTVVPLLPNATSPFVDIEVVTDFGAGYFYRIRGKAPGVVRVIADAPGVHAEIPIVVRP